MIQKGKVISCDGNIATVEILRESACSGCHNRDTCGTGAIASCTKAEKVTVAANNLCGAKAGDDVVLESDNLRSIAIAFCVFILPIIIAFASYFLSAYLFDGKVLPYIVAGVLFAVSFFGFFFGIDKKLSKKISVNITRVTED